MPHKFILGQAVAYTPPTGTYAPPGIYVVTAKLPERDGASMEPIAWQRGLCFGLRRDPVTEAQSLADVLSCGSSAGRQGDE